MASGAISCLVFRYGDGSSWSWVERYDARSMHGDAPQEALSSVSCLPTISLPNGHHFDTETIFKK